MLESRLHHPDGIAEIYRTNIRRKNYTCERIEQIEMATRASTYELIYT